MPENQESHTIHFSIETSFQLHKCHAQRTPALRFNIPRDLSHVRLRREPHTLISPQLRIHTPVPQSRSSYLNNTAYKERGLAARPLDLQVKRQTNEGTTLVGSSSRME